MDPPLIFIGILLIGTVIAFISGAIPYPFGIIVLSALLIARLAYLANKR